MNGDATFVADGAADRKIAPGPTLDRRRSNASNDALAFTRR